MNNENLHFQRHTNFLVKLKFGHFAKHTKFEKKFPLNLTLLKGGFFSERADALSFLQTGKPNYFPELKF